MAVLDRDRKVRAGCDWLRRERPVAMLAPWARLRSGARPRCGSWGAGTPWGRDGAVGEARTQLKHSQRRSFLQLAGNI